MTVVNVFERLKLIRKALHMTQDEFSTILQVSKPTISRYETGDRCPDAEFLQILLNQYNVNVNWLLGGESPMFLDEYSDNRPVSSLENYEEIKELLEMLEIPQIRRAVLVEAEKLRQLFGHLIKERLADKKENRGKKKSMMG